MSRGTTSLSRVVLGALLLACIAPAFARNDRLMIPIEPALRSNGTRQLVAPDIALRFGKASAEGLDTSAGVALAHGQATPFQAGNSNNGGRPGEARSDEAVCLDAFRQALVQLQARARAAGASAVVGIVNNYNGTEVDSPSSYECHIGRTRGIVDLKGLLASAPAAAPAPASAPAKVDAAPERRVAGVQPPKLHTGFAAIDDVNAVPYLSDRGRAEYAKWLTWATPRAFAIASNGYFWQTSGLNPREPGLPSDPSERALLGCERAAGMPCKLYAVNGAVVWPKEPQ